MATRILVVDDNRRTLRAYTMELQTRVKPRGWDAQVASGPANAFVEVEQADTVTAALRALRD
jgi:hypothetical protein